MSNTPALFNPFAIDMQFLLKSYVKVIDHQSQFLLDNSEILYALHVHRYPLNNIVIELLLRK